MSRKPVRDSLKAPITCQKHDRSRVELPNGEDTHIAHGDHLETGASRPNFAHVPSLADTRIRDARYKTHARATLCGGQVYMILCSDGEMKISTDGVQVFDLPGDRWRLMGAQRMYELWKEIIRNTELAGRLFTTALNLAEDRRGLLLLALDDPEMAASLVSRTDLLTSLPNHAQHAIAGAKDATSCLGMGDESVGRVERDEL